MCSSDLLAFYIALKVFPDHHIALGRAFFVWVSVFNLFVVSVFWSFMADLFTNAQGRRLFGAIAVVLAAVNIFGGFIVTHRMLSMFKKKTPVKK